MSISKNGIALLQATIVAGGIATGLWLAASTPSGALVDTSQLLSGGGLTNAGAQGPVWTSPGFPFVFFENQPGAGKGPLVPQLRMPDGVLSGLKVKVTTVTAATGGTLILTVLKNGVDTGLSCSTTGTGNCTSNTLVTFANNDRLSVRVVDALTGTTNVGFSYTLVFN